MKEIDLYTNIYVYIHIKLFNRAEGGQELVHGLSLQIGSRLVFYYGCDALTTVPLVDVKILSSTRVWSAIQYGTKKLKLIITQTHVRCGYGTEWSEKA